MIDIQTAEAIAGLLARRKDCQTAAQIVRREIATAKLKEEMIPPYSEIWECCKLMIQAGIGVAVVFGLLWAVP